METAREARYVLLLDDRVRLYGRVTECAYDLCIVRPFSSLFGPLIGSLLNPTLE